jgi:phage-related protein
MQEKDGDETMKISSKMRKAIYGENSKDYYEMDSAEKRAYNQGYDEALRRVDEQREADAKKRRMRQ